MFDDTGSFRHGPDPLQRCSPPPDRPAFSRNPTPLRFRHPSTTRHGLAPYRAVRHSHPGSALRLSQPLSGFLAGPRLAALFHAAAIPGLYLQSLPLTEIAHPSRGRQLPCSHPPACGRARPAALSPARSPDSHARTQSPDSLAAYGSPFHELAPASRSPWATDRGTSPFRQLHLLRSLVPPVSPFTADTSFPEPTGRYSPGLLPL